MTPEVILSLLLPLLLLALTALGALVMVFGTNIRKDISKLFDLMTDHAQSDTDDFKEVNARAGRLAQRLTKLDGRTEEA